MNVGDAKLPMMSLDDYGRAVASVFDDPKTYAGQRFGFASSHMTGKEIAAVFTKQTGVDVKYMAMPDAAMVKAGGPSLGQMIANMYIFFRKGEKSACELRDLKKSAKLT